MLYLNFDNHIQSCNSKHPLLVIFCITSPFTIYFLAISQADLLRHFWQLYIAFCQYWLVIGLFPVKSFRNLAKNPCGSYIKLTAKSSFPCKFIKIPCKIPINRKLIQKLLLPRLHPPPFNKV